jgi:hypothetical protein
VLLAAITCTKDTNASQRTITAPAGWTVIKTEQTTPTTGTAGELIWLGYRVADGSETADYTWTHDATADRVTGAMQRFSGVDTTNPTDVAASSVSYNNTSGTTAVVPAITTVTANTLLVSMAALHSSTVAWTVPTSWTLINTSTGTGRRQSWATIAQASAGTTGTVTWTKVSGTERRAAILTALRPATATNATLTLGAGRGAGAGGPVTLSVPAPSNGGLTIGAASASGAAGAGQLGVAFNGTLTVGPGRAAGAAGHAGVFPLPVLTQCVVGYLTIRTRTTTADTVRLKLATDSGLTTGVVWSAPLTPDGLGNAFHDLSGLGLTAGTKYYWRAAMSVGGNEVLDTWATTGEVPTPPSGASNWAWTFGGCTDNTDAACMSTMRGYGDPITANHGDLYYDDGAATTVASYRTHFDAKITAANHAALMRTTLYIYTCSDHDFGMNNDVTGVGTPGVVSPFNQVVRESFPAPYYQSTTGVYYTFPWGRARYIVTDGRSFKSPIANTDNSSKTVFGATQKQWIKDTITAATEPLIIFISDTAFTGTTTAGEDDWSGYNTERQELVTFFAASGKKFLWTASDMHAVAGSHGTTASGGMPDYQAGPFDNTASQKAPPWDVGPYPASGTAVVQQYGRVVLTDNGDTITTVFSGYSNPSTLRVTLTDVFDTAVLTAGGGKGAGSAGSASLSGTSNATLSVGAGRAGGAGGPTALSGTSNAGLTVGAGRSGGAGGPVALTATSTATLTVGGAAGGGNGGAVALSGVMNATLTVGAAGSTGQGAPVVLFAGASATLPIGAGSSSGQAGSVGLSGVRNVTLPVGAAAGTGAAGSATVAASQPNATLTIGAAGATGSAGSIGIGATSNGGLTIGPAGAASQAGTLTLSGISNTTLAIGAASGTGQAGTARLVTPNATMLVGAAVGSGRSGTVTLAAPTGANNVTWTTSTGGAHTNPFRAEEAHSNPFRVTGP